MDSSEGMVHRAILWQSIQINLNQKLPVFKKKKNHHNNKNQKALLFEKHLKLSSPHTLR